jgi:hypothetical protein
MLSACSVSMQPPSLLVRSRAHRGPGRSSPCLSFFQDDAALFPVHRTQLTCVAGAARLALAFTEDVETSVVKLCSAIDYRHLKLTSPYAHLCRPRLIARVHHRSSPVPPARCPVLLCRLLRVAHSCHSCVFRHVPCAVVCSYSDKLLYFGVLAIDSR